MCFSAYVISPAKFEADKTTTHASHGCKFSLLPSCFKNSSETHGESPMAGKRFQSWLDKYGVLLNDFDSISWPLNSGGRSWASMRRYHCPGGTPYSQSLDKDTA